MLAVPTIGANIGLMLGSLWPSMLMPADKVHLVYPLGAKFIHIIQETGYLHLQATKPDTIGTWDLGNENSSDLILTNITLS